MVGRTGGAILGLETGFYYFFISFFFYTLLLFTLPLFSSDLFMLFLSGIGSRTFLELILFTTSGIAFILFLEEQFEKRSSTSSASVPAHSKILAYFLFLSLLKVYCSLASFLIFLDEFFLLALSSIAFFYFLEAI